MQDQQDYVVRSLKALGRKRWWEVAKESRVSFYTIEKIVKGETSSPRYNKLKPLLKWLAMHPVEGVSARMIR